MRDRLGKFLEKFSSAYSGEPDLIARGPGRVDLIGIHTDYNDGFVLPIAVNMDVWTGVRKRPDNRFLVHSANFDSQVEFSLDDIPYDESATWSNYVRGVVLYLKEAGAGLGGADMLIEGNVPIGSGLSSSAAIEMAVAYALQRLFEFEMSGPELALVGKRAENDFVGINTGIMDQFTSRLGRKDHALFLDCRMLEYEQVPLDTENYKILVCDTAKRRGLVDSEYNLRRSQCEEAARMFAEWKPGVKALRDVAPEDFERWKDRVPEVIGKRAEHIIYENDRGLKAHDVLKAGDMQTFGNLMNASHDSARDLYEVSCPELEAMVAVSRAIGGVLSARLAGAGFGGCTVSLAPNSVVDEFLTRVPMDYESRTGLKPTIYVCTAEDGTSVVWTR